jgi:hypothetical protein
MPRGGGGGGDVGGGAGGRDGNDRGGGNGSSGRGNDGRGGRGLRVYHIYFYLDSPIYLEEPSGYPAQPGLTWRNQQVTQPNQD